MKALIFLLSLLPAISYANLIGTITGTITDGCDACFVVAPDGSTLVSNYNFFGLGQNADLTGQEFTFTFEVADSVFERTPFVDQAGYSLHWLVSPSEIPGFINVNDHTVALNTNGTGVFSRYGYLPDGSTKYWYDAEWPSPDFTAPNNEVTLASFVGIPGAGGGFHYQDHIGLIDPDTHLAVNWNSTFNGTIESFTLVNRSEVPEPSSIAIFSAGVALLLLNRKPKRVQPR